MLGGELGELFMPDISAAVSQCASCGATAMMAQTMVYADAPGLIARCPACGAVMLRFVRGSGRAWLDLRGTSYLQFPMPAQP